MLDVRKQGTHVLPVRVYYEDTDAAGIVYYANYLKFAERARTEFMRDVSDGHYARMLEDGQQFVVRRCTIEYGQPARLDDLLEIHSRILDIGAATIAAEQVVRRGGAELVRMTVDLVCVGRDGRPLRVPAPLRHVLDGYRVAAA